MKVLAAIVIPPHLSVSGAVNAAKSLSTALAEYCTIDVALMAQETRQSALGNAVLFERCATNPFQFSRSFLPDKFRTLFYYSDIPAIVHTGGYDLVHLHNVIPTMELRRIAKVCVTKGIPYVISTHGFVEILNRESAYSLTIFEELVGKWLIDRPLRYVVDNASKIFALSPMEIPLLTELGIPDGKISIVTNGVNEFFLEDPPPHEIEHVIHKFALPTQSEARPRVSFFLGNHTANKGLPVLLEALSITKVPYLMLIGGKKRNTIDYASYTARCSSNQRIVVTDELSDQEIRALFHYADFFVFPTRADTLPLAILEAMASSLPILSTQVGGIPYQVDHTYGQLVAPNDVNALRKAFEQFCQQPFLKKMGAAARSAVELRFRWKTVAQTAIVEYQRILEPTLSKIK